VSQKNKQGAGMNDLETARTKGVSATKPRICCKRSYMGELLNGVLYGGKFYPCSSKMTARAIARDMFKEGSSAGYASIEIKEPQ
jgi:hypothetical protein